MLKDKQKLQSTIFLVTVVLVLLFISNRNDNEATIEESKTLRIATTTSIADTGLIEALSDLFYKDTGIQLTYIATGTGAAMELGRSGEVDALFVHDEEQEKTFIQDGYGLERVLVMYNDFVVLGPQNQTFTSDRIEGFFQHIYEEQLPFLSRGDASGTNARENLIWEELRLDPTNNPNYMESGQGMGATILMANEKQTFTFADRSTYVSLLSQSDQVIDIVIVFEDETSLQNQYSIITINPEKFQDVKTNTTKQFIEWITSEEVQQFIAKFGMEEFGQSVFIPNAINPTKK